jgi:hypothetical protein
MLVVNPEAKDPRMSNSKIKIILFCFLAGTAVNQTFYMEVLERLFDALRRKLVDSSPQHSGTSFVSSVDVLAGKCVSDVDYPPYSPDVAAADFWLIP